MRFLGKSFPLRFAAAFSLLAVAAYAPGLVGLPIDRPYRALERIWHDASFRMQTASLKTGDPRLILLAVDDATVRELGFPLPRKFYTQALGRLQELGVKTVAFDVLFLEPREGDEEFAAATKRHGSVAHLYLVKYDEKLGKSVPQLTIPPLRKAAAELGSPGVDRHLEADGHLRSFALFNPDEPDPVRPGWPLVSLAAATLSLYEGKALGDYRSAAMESGDWSLINFRRPRVWPLPRDAEGYVVYNPPYLHIPMLDLLKGRLDAAQKKALRGALVIVGSTTTGYYDHYPTPFTQISPGAEAHLNILDNVLNGDALPSPSASLTLLLILVAAWIPYFLLRFSSPAVEAGAVAALLGALVWGCLRGMGRGVLVYPVGPGLTLLGSFLALTIHRVLTEGAEKRMIKGMFGQFVSPDVVEELAANPEKARLGAQKRDMTVFFLDIAHFTTISEKMGPEALMAFLNKYLSALSQVVLERRGTIDKYIGDCIMAFWNAPLENADHRTDAVLAALGCQAAIAELNKSLDPGLPEVPAIRIGVNSGEVNVGFTGTQRKLQYTVIGDEVNLASRLEGANKFFGSRIIVSESTWQGARHAAEARYLGKARVVGKATPVAVYEPLAPKGALSGAWAQALPVWERGIEAFYAKRYDAAAAAFEEFSRLMPGDGPGSLYLNLSRDYQALPPEDWDQVFNLTAK